MQAFNVALTDGAPVNRAGGRCWEEFPGWRTLASDPLETLRKVRGAYWVKTLDKNTVRIIQRKRARRHAAPRCRCQAATLIETNQGVNRRTWMGIWSCRLSSAASVSSSGKWPDTGNPPAAMETRSEPLR